MKVEISELCFDAILGILPHERQTPQKVVIHLSFIYNFDAITREFIDYSLVASLIEETMKTQKFLLIEDAIVFLEHLLLEKFPMEQLKLQIIKPTILENAVVSVSN